MGVCVCVCVFQVNKGQPKGPFGPTPYENLWTSVELQTHNSDIYLNKNTKTVKLHLIAASPKQQKWN